MAGGVKIAGGRPSVDGSSGSPPPPPSGPRPTPQLPSQRERIDEFCRDEMRRCDLLHAAVYRCTKEGPREERSMIDRVLSRQDPPEDISDWAWGVAASDVDSGKQRSGVFMLLVHRDRSKLSAEASSTAGHRFRVDRERSPDDPMDHEAPVLVAREDDDAMAAGGPWALVTRELAAHNRYLIDRDQRGFEMLMNGFATVMKESRSTNDELLKTIQVLTHRQRKVEERVAVERAESVAEMERRHELEREARQEERSDDNARKFVGVLASVADAVLPGLGAQLRAKLTQQQQQVAPAPPAGATDAGVARAQAQAKARRAAAGPTAPISTGQAPSAGPPPGSDAFTAAGLTPRDVELYQHLRRGVAALPADVMITMAPKLSGDALEAFTKASAIMAAQDSVDPAVASPSEPAEDADEDADADADEDEDEDDGGDADESA